MADKYQDCVTKTERINFIKTKLVNDDRWLIRGLLAIYNHQTIDEQNAQSVHNHNGIGFTRVDGHILTSFAQQAIARGVQHAVKNPTFNATAFLSPKQLGILKAKMPKYAKQLHAIKNQK